MLVEDISEIIQISNNEFIGCTRLIEMQVINDDLFLEITNTVFVKYFQ